MRPEVEQFWEQLALYLNKQGLKQTRQRTVIIEQFLKIQKHADAASIHSSLRGQGHRIGLATIYRTLNMLHEAGLVDQHSFNDGRAVFELRAPGAHHDHLVCTRCGCIVEFENEAIERLQRRIARDRGFTLLSHRLELYGHCARCQ